MGAGLCPVGRLGFPEEMCAHGFLPSLSPKVPKLSHLSLSLAAVSDLAIAKTVRWPGGRFWWRFRLPVAMSLYSKSYCVQVLTHSPHRNPV